MIICAAGKGKMSEKACLDCALSGGNICGYDYGLLKTMFQKADRQGIHVTDLTQCLLKSYWTKTSPVPKHVHEMLVLTLGTVAHEIFEVNDEYMESELVLEADEIVGRADVVYKDGKIVDYKTTRWLKPSNLPYGSHELQVNVYAHLLRQTGREVKSAFIQYIDMSGPTKCRKKGCNVTYRWNGSGPACPNCGDQRDDAHLGAVLFEVPLWQEGQIADWVKLRRDTLSKAIEGGVEPGGEPGWLCKYCDFAERCPYV